MSNYLHSQVNARKTVEKMKLNSNSNSNDNSTDDNSDSFHREFSYININTPFLVHSSNHGSNIFSNDFDFLNKMFGFLVSSKGSDSSVSNLMAGTNSLLNLKLLKYYSPQFLLERDFVSLVEGCLDLNLRKINGRNFEVFSSTASNEDIRKILMKLTRNFSMLNKQVDSKRKIFIESIVKATDNRGSEVSTKGSNDTVSQENKESSSSNSNEDSKKKKSSREQRLSAQLKDLKLGEYNTSKQPREKENSGKLKKNKLFNAFKGEVLEEDVESSQYVLFDDLSVAETKKMLGISTFPYTSKLLYEKYLEAKMGVKMSDLPSQYLEKRLKYEKKQMI